VLGVDKCIKKVEYYGLGADKCIEKVECCGIVGDKNFQKFKSDLLKIHVFFTLFQPKTQDLIKICNKLMYFCFSLACKTF